MSKISIFNKDTDSALAQQLNPIVYLPKINCPNTTVVKRAQCTDFSNDLMPRFGIERVMTQSIQEVQGETGPNGERVFKPINDVHDAVRFVGDWTALNNSYGSREVATISGGTSPYVEITFYGTGLNLLTVALVSMTGASYSLDGGSNTAFWSATASDVLGGRNYSSNTLMPVVNTTLGLHTVKIFGTAGSAFYFAGYEVLNTNSTLQQTAGTSYLGGKRLYNSALSTSSPTSGFTNTYGTAGTRGGHVLVYQKADGSVAKDIRYTETAAAYLSSASHANEDVIKTHHWREFGAGRSDDFSSVTPATNTAKAFTLDDGTTTLVCDAAGSDTQSGLEGLVASGVSKFITLTFVGTGLDVITANDGTRTDTVFVDGASIGTLTATTAVKNQKIISGLPYGTHTVKFLSDPTAGSNRYVKFITYGPSKPALPAGCVELADYYTMADYVAVGTPSDIALSQGVLAKFASRELVYSGTWTSSSIAGGLGLDGDFDFRSSTATSYYEYTFFGTGVELRGFFLSANVINQTVTVDGLALNAGSNIGSASSFISAVTGLTLSAAGVLTGTVSGQNHGVIKITGLALGKHTVRMTQNTTTNMYAVGVNPITPIHAPKGNLPGDIQNTLTVGSCALSDNRKFSATSVKTLANWAQAVGLATTTTTSTAPVPTTDLSCTIKTNGNPVQIFYCMQSRSSAIGVSSNTQVYVDGVAVGKIKYLTHISAGYDYLQSDSIIVPLAAGVHKIDVYWWNGSAATFTSIGDQRTLTVMEL